MDYWHTHSNDQKGNVQRNAGCWYAGAPNSNVDTSSKALDDEAYGATTGAAGGIEAIPIPSGHGISGNCPSWSFREIHTYDTARLER
mmetsp:Transcript_2651/g.4060  ORF Transcript_2651/g.4060 Transcript_2651/m.4060 type:complete len:87 (+) Transcript_2651:389-649(+)